MDFLNRNIHIIGMARSGFAAAEVLVSLGARLTMHDRKDAAQLTDELNRISELGITARIGDSAYADIDEADYIVASPGVPGTCPGLVVAREKRIPVMSEIELAYRISPAPIIAVTGTNGKTTTTALIGEIMQRSGRKTFIAGNIVAGSIRLPLVSAAAQASPSDVIVAEISSFQLETITSFRPKVAALLNITGDHMDRYPDLEPYARAKVRLFEYQLADDYAVLNADDPMVMRYAANFKSRIWTFTLKGNADFGTFHRGTEVWANTGSGEYLVCDTADMKLRGIHNLQNVLAAAAAGLAFGVDPSSIQEAVNSFAAPEHRLEPVLEINGIEFLNNSMCTNVAAGVCSLEAIGRPAVVIAGGKDKGSDYTALGAAFAKYAKHVVLIGKDAHLLESAARAAGFDRISHASSMEDAVEKSWEIAETGDTVLLSPCCASFDMFDDFEHRGRVFKDSVIAIANRVEVKR